MFKIILAIALFSCIPVAAEPAPLSVGSSSFVYQNVASKDLFPRKRPRATVALSKKTLAVFAVAPSAESAKKITELKSLFALLEEETKKL